MKKTILIFLAAIISIISCKDDESFKDPTPKDTSPKEGILNISDISLDFGSINVGEIKELELTLKNDGDKEIELNNFSLSYGAEYFEIDIDKDRIIKIQPGNFEVVKIYFKPKLLSKNKTQLNFEEKIGEYASKTYSVELKGISDKDNRPIFEVPEYLSYHTFDIDGDGKVQLEEVTKYKGEIMPISAEISEEDLLKIYELKNITSLILPTLHNFPEIDFSKFSKLKKIQCSGNNFTKIDLSKNLELEHLIVDNTNIRTLNTAKNTKLKIIWIENNKLENINLANGNNLNCEYVYIRGNNPCIKVDQGITGEGWEIGNLKLSTICPGF